VAASNAPFKAAQHLFENFIRRNNAASKATGGSSHERLLQYFEARRLYESGCLESFDRAKLLRLRQERSEFSSGKHEALYAQWKSGGPGFELEIAESETVAGPLILGAFSTFLLEHDYELFGHFPG
jgi:hypothetical protein